MRCDNGESPQQPGENLKQEIAMWLHSVATERQTHAFHKHSMAAPTKHNAHFKCDSRSSITCEYKSNYKLCIQHLTLQCVEPLLLAMFPLCRAARTIAASTHAREPLASTARSKTAGTEARARQSTTQEKSHHELKQRSQNDLKG